MTNTEVPVERRRRRLVINPRLQYTLVRLAIAIWIPSAAFVFGFVCYLYAGPSGIERVLGASPTRVLPSPPPQLLLLAAFTACACLLFAVGGVLYFSHRIAGPAYRLKRSMHRVTAGDLDFVISLRRHDCFNDVCDSFNEMLGAIGDRAQRDITTLRNVEDTLAPDSPERGELRAMREAKELQVYGAVEEEAVRDEPQASSSSSSVALPILVSEPTD